MQNASDRMPNGSLAESYSWAERGGFGSGRFAVAEGRQLLGFRMDHDSHPSQQGPLFPYGQNERKPVWENGGLFRQALHLSAHHFVFGVFGYLRESKRIMNILRSFDAIHRALPYTALLLAGEFVSSDLERAVEPFLRRSGILRMGHLPERDFWIAAGAVDTCINVRYPAAGETSGIAVRMMGIGKPVMVTDSEETVCYPETACFRIAPGIAEKASLTEYGILAASLPQTTREIGARGARHIRSSHELDRVADEYWQTLCAHGR